MRFSIILIPLFILIVFIYAIIKKTNAYESFIYGAKEGLNQSFDILPYIISMYIAVKVFNASGILEDILRLSKIPPKLIAQGIFRSFSSNASLSYMIDIFNEYGPDSKLGMASSVLQGATDTTFYVLTLYFGSVKVTNYRYSSFIGISSDILCLVLSILMYFYVF